MINKESMLISIIITSFNWPEALEKCLQSLKEQSDRNFEVIISDDGSSPSVETMINKIKPTLPFLLKFLWQKHNGFHISKTRNKGIAKSSGDYIIFLDQDNILNQHFIKRQRYHAEPNFFGIHQRIFLNQKLTKKILKSPKSIATKSPIWVLKERLLGNTNKWLASINIPFKRFRYTKKNKWTKTASCFAIWKKDLIKVNGFNENYKSWGYEDSDLLVRLLKKNIFRKSVKNSCFIYHLHHKTVFKSEAEKNLNLDKLNKAIAGKTEPFPGLDQYL
eukprot:COSAG01_NODE_69_length_28801_cov_10.460038_20_plen_276_part_00